MAERKAIIERKTKETDIRLELNLDGVGSYDINTGVGFLDHMLTHLSKHGKMDLTVKATGDLEVDAHHTVEDIAICLGQCLDKALGDKKGIARDPRTTCRSLRSAVTIHTNRRAAGIISSITRW